MKALEGSKLVEVSLEDAKYLLFVIWVILLVPWIFFAPLSLMAFAGGSTVFVYTFLFFFWTYPLAVFIVWKFRDKSPLIVLLPCLNIAVVVGMS
jgi:hypothetical protein